MGGSLSTPSRPPVEIKTDSSTGNPIITEALEEAPEAGASTPAAATTEKTTLAAPVAATTPKAVALASKTTEAKVITNEQPLSGGSRRLQKRSKQNKTNRRKGRRQNKSKRRNKRISKRHNKTRK